MGYLSVKIESVKDKQDSRVQLPVTKLNLTISTKSNSCNEN